MGNLFELVKAYTTGNSKYGDGRPEFVKEMFKESSVPLEEGGDTHFHKWDSGTGVTVTTRTGDFEDHTQIREHSSFNSGEDLSGFRSTFGDDNKSVEDLTGFRSVFGDDNE